MNDIIVMGSDGLFDNLYDEDILKCIKPYLKGKLLEDVTGSVNCMAEEAERKSYDKSYFSPFAKGAKEAGKRFMGGKSDDITVIVA